MIEQEPQVYRFLVESEEAAPAKGPVRGFLRRLQELLAAGISHELRLPPDDLRSGLWAAAILGMVQTAGVIYSQPDDDAGALPPLRFEWHLMAAPLPAYSWSVWRYWR